MAFSSLDSLFLIIIIILSVRCAVKGFIAEVMSVAAIFIGFGGAIILSGLGSLIIAKYLGESPWNSVISFLLIFIILYLIVKIFENALHNFLESLELENLDKALGFLLGIIEGIAAVFILIIIMIYQPFDNLSGILSNSLFVKITHYFLPELIIL